MRAPAWVKRVRWGRPRRRPDGTREVTVTFTADISGLNRQLHRINLELDRLAEREKWRTRVLAERHDARRWLDGQVMVAWQRYGWVKPTGRAVPR